MSSRVATEPPGRVLRRTPGPGPGLRQLKRDRTRADLVDAARELFAEVGYRDARTAEIARRALVSEATLFRYFGSKADLALADVAEATHDALARVCARPEGESALVALQATVDEVLAGGAFASPELLGEIALVLEHPGVQSRLFGLISEARVALAPCLARRLGVPADGIEAEVAARAVVGALQTAIGRWAADPAGRGLAETVHACLAVLGDLLEPAPRSSSPAGGAR